MGLVAFQLVIVLMTGYYLLVGWDFEEYIMFANTQMDKVIKYKTEAEQMLDAGFTTQAAKKRAMSTLAYAWEYLSELVRYQYLIMPSEKYTDEMTQLYYDFPSRAAVFNQKWADKVNNLFGVDYPVWWDLKNLADAIKLADINPVQPKVVDPVIERAYKTIQDQIETAKSDVVYGMKLVEIFGNLPVSVTAHYCHMSNGTSYLRCFWFLAGRMVKLSTIIATLQKIKAEEAK